MKIFIVAAVWVGTWFLASELDSPLIGIISTIAMLLSLALIGGNSSSSANREKSRYEQIREDLYAYKSITTASPHLDMFKDKNSKENKK